VARSLTSSLTNLIVSALLAKSIEALTAVVNLNTALAHPFDKARAQELFKALHQHGVPLHHAEIADIAKACGWPDDSAEDIALLGERIGRGGRVTIKHPRDWGGPTVARLKRELDA
jgi:hypothetical protein